MWIAILFITHITLNLFALYALIKDGSRPVRVWAWILIITFLPVLGVTLYYFFGVNLRKRKLFNLKKVIDYQQFENFITHYSKEIEKKVLQRKDVTTMYLNLIRLLTRTNGSLLTFNNRIQILNDGSETFEAIFDQCEKAQAYIHLQYYLIRDGDLTDRFKQIFSRKLKEGVKVRLLYDHLGSWDLSNEYVEELKQLGVMIFPFMPVRFGNLARVNYRNHRKILIVDGDVGFIGGINVDDKYIHDNHELGHWTDTHLRLHGTSVNFLHFVFLCDWQFVTGEKTTLSL